MVSPPAKRHKYKLALTTKIKSMHMANILAHPVKEYLPVIIALSLLSSCITGRQTIESDILTFPLYPIDPPPTKLLLLNTFDVPTDHMRENKQKLFLSLLDTLLFEMSREVSRRTAIPSEVVCGITGTDDSGSLMLARMAEHQSSHAIAITYFDIHFYQTEVVVTEEQDGKSKEAYYDILSEIHYSLYDEDGFFNNLQITESRHHSSRSVLSGLLAAGPNIVSNKEDALNIARENMVTYLNNFLPGRAIRKRTLFTGKEMGEVNAAAAKGNYDVVLEECLRLVNHPDPIVAAKANYNCAILYENKKLPYKAKNYLEQSLRLYSFPESRAMMSDYGIY
jgi:Family of unknown function (DUF6340)